MHLQSKGTSLWLFIMGNAASVVLLRSCLRFDTRGVERLAEGSG